ncbi:hypothetical protein ACFY1U_17230 [Streptomyces sp. NPDC001351]|uniref:hypothetical protein n=1 Tax=Streptomyces sp. NPDC001351 TaxID=3364564 RepID=UPI0036AEF0FB
MPTVQPMGEARQTLARLAAGDGGAGTVQLWDISTQQTLGPPLPTPGTTRL